MPDQAVSFLAGTAVHPPGGERRATVRYRCRVGNSSRVFLAPNFETKAAVIQNVTANGIGLLLGRPVEPGTLLLVQADGAAGFPFERLACVVHTREQVDGRWLVGCKFAAPLQEDEL